MQVTKCLRGGGKMWIHHQCVHSLLQRLLVAVWGQCRGCWWEMPVRWWPYF